MTNYPPTFQSPITVSGETSALGADLSLQDVTGLPICLIQGLADTVLLHYLPDMPSKPGQLVDSGAMIGCRLLPKEIYGFGKTPEATLPPADGLNEQFRQAGLTASATDLTHGKAIIKLSGTAAGETLQKICGLDFHESVFPTGQVKQTSAAKIKTLIARSDENDLPTYYLHVDRPFGQYFWDTLWDAATH